MSGYIAPPTQSGLNEVVGSLTVLASGPYSPNLPGASSTPTPGGVATGKVWDYGGELFDVLAAGAVADGMVDINCSITSGTANLATTTSPGPFVAADAGKAFSFAGAGAAGAVLQGTIAAFVDSQHLTLSVNAGTSIVAGTQGFALGTDNTTAFSTAVTAATIAGIGSTVLIPPGTRANRGYYLDGITGTAGCITPASGVRFQGGGINATTIYPSVWRTGGSGDLFRLVIPVANPYATFVQVSDLTIDCSGQYVGGVLGGVVGTYSNPFTLQGVSNVRLERLRIIKPFGFGMVIGTVAGGTPYAQNLTIKDIYFEGGSRNGNDLIGGGGINNMLIDNIVAVPAADGTAIYGTVYDHTNMTNVSLRNIFCKTTQAAPTAAAIASDFGAQRFSVESCFIEGFKYGILIASTASGQTSEVRIRNVHVKTVTTSAIFFNTTATFGVQDFAIQDCSILAWDSLAGARAAFDIQGGHDGVISNNVFGAVTTAYCILIRGDAGSLAANPPTRVDVHDNDVKQATNTIFLQFIGAAPVGIYVRNNMGFNPQGGVGGAPGFPATTVAQQNTSGMDWMAYITNGAASLSCVVTAPGGNKTIVIPASAMVPILIPANETFTPTYASGAPAWAIYQL